MNFWTAKTYIGLNLLFKIKKKGCSVWSLLMVRSFMNSFLYWIKLNSFWPFYARMFLRGNWCHRFAFSLSLRTLWRHAYISLFIDVLFIISLKFFFYHYVEIKLVCGCILLFYWDHQSFKIFFFWPLTETLNLCSDVHYWLLCTGLSLEVSCQER